MTGLQGCRVLVDQACGNWRSSVAFSARFATPSLALSSFFVKGLLGRQLIFHATLSDATIFLLALLDQAQKVVRDIQVLGHFEFLPDQTSNAMKRRCSIFNVAWYSRRLVRIGHSRVVLRMSAVVGICELY